MDIKDYRPVSASQDEDYRALAHSMRGDSKLGLLLLFVGFFASVIGSILFVMFYLGGYKEEAKNVAWCITCPGTVLMLSSLALNKFLAWFRLRKEIKQELRRIQENSKRRPQ